MTSEQRPHVVIVGGGFGGLQAALRLKNRNVRVTLLDRNNHHLFQPLLYQVATAALSPGDIAAPLRAILARAANTTVLLAEVTAVDTVQRAVTFTNVPTQEVRRLPYDYLILATGAHHSYFGNDEWEAFAPGLKSIADATELRKRTLLAFERAELDTDDRRRKSDLTFLLIGGGPTGIEMAGSIAEMAHREFRGNFRHFDPEQARIVLVEAGPRVLPAFPEALSLQAACDLERMGVEVRTNTRVEQIDADGAVMNGERIDARTMIWCAGVAASPAARWLHAEADRSGRVIVNRTLNIEGHPEIFVIGDTAHIEEEAGTPLPGLAPVAIQQGRYVADRILRLIKGEHSETLFHYVSKGDLATIGRSKAIFRLGWIKLHGLLAWMMGLVVHLFYLIGFRNRVIVILQWFWAYITYQRGVRLIVMQPREQQVGQE